MNARRAREACPSLRVVQLRRLIWISSMGIYDEVPGQRYNSVLDPYRKSVRVIEASDLDYTILRPAWFTNADEVDSFAAHAVGRAGHGASSRAGSSIGWRISTACPMVIEP